MARLKMPGKKLCKDANKLNSSASQGDTTENKDDSGKEENVSADEDMFSITVEEFDEIFGESSGDEKDFLGFEPHELIQRKRVLRRSNVYRSRNPLKAGNTGSPPSKRRKLSDTSGSKDNQIKSKQISKDETATASDMNPYAKKYSSFRRRSTPAIRSENMITPVKKIIQHSKTDTPVMKTYEHKLIAEKTVIIETEDIKPIEIPKDIPLPLTTEVALLPTIIKIESKPERLKRDKFNNSNSSCDNNPYAKHYNTHGRDKSKIKLNRIDDSANHFRLKRKQDMAKKILSKARENRHVLPKQDIAKEMLLKARENKHVNPKQDIAKEMLLKARENKHVNPKQDIAKEMLLKARENKHVNPKQDIAKEMLLKARENKHVNPKQLFTNEETDEKIKEKCADDFGKHDREIKKKSVRLKNVSDNTECEKPKKSRLKNLSEDDNVQSKYQRATFSSNENEAINDDDKTDLLKCDDDINQLSTVETDTLQYKVQDSDLNDVSLDGKVNNVEKESAEDVNVENVIGKRRSSLRSQQFTSKPDYKEKCDNATDGSGICKWSDDSDDEVPLAKLSNVDDDENATKKTKVFIIQNKIKHTAKNSTNKTISIVADKTVGKTGIKNDKNTPVLKKKRRIRCQQCDGCLVAKDCRNCIYCKDRVCYGGRGVMKKSCVKRQCTNPVEKLECELSKIKKTTVKVQKTVSPKKNVKIKKAFDKETVSVPSIPRCKKEESSNSSLDIGDSKNNVLPKDVVVFGRAKPQSWKSDFKITLPWPEGDNEDAAWKCGYHFCIVLPSSMPKGDLCFLCGSSGFGEMVHCQYCSEAFHAYCLDIDPVDAKKWSCDRCKRCTVCGLKQNLLMCDHCHDCYHSDCLGPNYQRETVGDCEFWMCGKCVKCEKCGARTSGKGNDKKWKYDFTMCHECGRLWRKGHYCMVCKKCYSEDDFEMEMALCTKCNHWIHRECEEINKDEYECLAELPDSIPYVCLHCHDGDTEPTWKKEVREEIQAGFQKVCFDMVASRDYKAMVKAISEEVPDESSDNQSQELFQKLSNHQLINVDSFVKEGSLLLDKFKSICQNGSADLVTSMRKLFLLSVKKLFPWHDVSLSTVEKKITNQPTMPKISFSNGILAINCDVVKADHCYCSLHQEEADNGNESSTTQEDNEHTDDKLSAADLDNISDKEPNGNIDIPSVPDTISLFCDKEENDSNKKHVSDPCSAVKCIDSKEHISNTNVVPILCIDTKAIDDCGTPSPGLGSPFTKWKRCQIDRRQCSLCGLCGHFTEADAGRLLLVGVNEWVHINCALWSAEVFEDKHGQLVNVHTAISRGKMLKCDVCQQYGATIGCCALRCPRSFHFQCARSIPTVLQDDKKLFCPQHSSKCEQKLVLDRDAFMVDRKVTVDLSKAKTQKKMQARFNAKDISLLCGSLRVSSFGQLTEASDTKQQLLPIGYRVNRMFWCTKNPQLRCLYVCSIEKVEEKTSQQDNIPLNMGGQTICHASLSSCSPNASTASLSISVPLITSCPKDSVPQSTTSTREPVKRKTPCPAKQTKCAATCQPSNVSNGILQSPSKQVTLLPRPTNGVSMLTSPHIPIQCNPTLYTPLMTNQSPVQNIFHLLESSKPEHVNHDAQLSLRQAAVSATRYQPLLPSPSITSQQHPHQAIAVNHAPSTHVMTSSLPAAPAIIPQNMFPTIIESSSTSPHIVATATDPTLFQALIQLQHALLASVRVNMTTGNTAGVSLSSLGINAGVVRHIYRFMECNQTLTRRHLPHLERLTLQQLGFPLRNIVKPSSIVVPLPYAPPLPLSNHQLIQPLNATEKNSTVAQFFNFSPSRKTKKPAVKTAETKVRKKQHKPPNDVKTNKVNTKSKIVKKDDSSFYDTAATVTVNSTSSKSTSNVSRKTSSGNVTRLKKVPIRRERKKVPQQSQPEKIPPKLKFIIRNDRGWECEDESIESVYTSLVRHINEIRFDQKDRPIPLTSSRADALDFFGLTKEPIVRIIEQLPGSRHCHQYMFKYHLPIKDDTDKVLPLNPHGCIRAEIIQRSETRDIFSWLASPHRQIPDFELENADDSSGIMTSAQDLPMAMRYRQLKNIARSHVGAYRSAIHGRGLFCKRCIEINDMIIEYSGIVIRKELTDKRELLYEKKGYGCYMFRVDDSDVVDATLFGNAARFINHSCDPNCHSKVISVDGRKKIIIFATRRIQVGEELTYDYKFPLEDEKIPCFCGSKKCRKYLN